MRVPCVRVCARARVRVYVCVCERERGSKEREQGLVSVLVCGLLSYVCAGLIYMSRINMSCEWQYRVITET